MGQVIRMATTAIVFASASAWCLNKNQSVESTQDLNRFASISIDAAFHNPAGLAFLTTNGLYLDGGSQTLLQTRTIQEPTPLLTAYGQPEYRGDIHNWLFPTLQAAYHLDKLTIFATFGPLGGGGTGEFDQGLPQFDNMILGFANGIGEQVKGAVGPSATGATPTYRYKRDISLIGDEMILGASTGAAYKIIPTLSVAGAYRFSYARYAYKGTANVSQMDVAYSGSPGLFGIIFDGIIIDGIVSSTTNQVFDSLWKNIAVDVVSTGVAHGAVVGLDFKPNEIWNIGMRFEWNSELEIKNKTKTLSAPDSLLPYLAAYADGAKSKITEPMVVAGGVSFKGVHNLTLESSWIFGLAKRVDQDGKEKDFHNSLMGGFGVRYQVLPIVEVATGYAHDWTYYNDAARLETDGDLPTHYIAAGASVKATAHLKINGSALWGIGQDRHGISKASGAQQNMSSNLVGFGVGLEWSPAI